ncbi:MAG: hypothetical protein N2039_09670 [Gemmataceae bacterium]|nr:hypothetical protein [Gemmataceae bacterium]
MRWLGLLVLGAAFVPHPDREPRRPQRVQADTVTALAVDPSSDRVAWGRLDGRFLVAARRTWESTPSIQWEQPAPPTAIAWSPDGAILAIADAEGNLLLSRPPFHKPPRRLQGHPSCIHGMAFTVEGTTFLTCGQDHRVRLWRTSDGELLTTWGPFGSPLFALAASPRGPQFAVGGLDGKIRLCQLSDGVVTHELAHEQGAVLSLALSHDGKYLASAGQDCSVRLWDVATGEPRRRLDGHGDPVVHVSFLGSSRRLISLSESGLIVVWDLATGEALHAERFPGATHCGTLVGQATFLAGTSTGRIVAWDIPPSVR